jgi:hypothetical protein
VQASPSSQSAATAQQLAMASFTQVSSAPHESLVHASASSQSASD